MTQRLKTLATLPEDSGSISSTPHGGLEVQPQGSNTLFWPLLAMHAFRAQTYMKAKHSSNKKYKTK